MEYEINGFTFITQKKLTSTPKKSEELEISFNKENSHLNSSILDDKSKTTIFFKGENEKIEETNFLEENIFYDFCHTAKNKIGNNSIIINNNINKNNINNNEKSKIEKLANKKNLEKILTKKISPKNFYKTLTKKESEQSKLISLIEHSTEYLIDKLSNNNKNNKNNINLLNEISKNIKKDLKTLTPREKILEQTELETNNMEEEKTRWKKIKNEVYENTLNEIFLKLKPETNKTKEIFIENEIEKKIEEIEKIKNELFKIQTECKNKFEEVYKKIFSNQGKRVKIDPFYIIKRMH